MIPEERILAQSGANAEKRRKLWRHAFRKSLKIGSFNAQPFPSHHQTLGSGTKHTVIFGLSRVRSSEQFYIKKAVAESGGRLVRRAPTTPTHFSFLFSTPPLVGPSPLFSSFKKKTTRSTHTNTLRPLHLFQLVAALCMTSKPIASNKCGSAHSCNNHSGEALTLSCMKPYFILQKFIHFWMLVLRWRPEANDRYLYVRLITL